MATISGIFKKKKNLSKLSKKKKGILSPPYQSPHRWWNHSTMSPTNGNISQITLSQYYPHELLCIYTYVENEAGRLKTACICTFTSCLLFYSDAKFAQELFTFSSCRLDLLSEVVQFKKQELIHCRDTIWLKHLFDILCSQLHLFFIEKEHTSYL